MKLRTGDLTWRMIDGDLVILDLRSSTYLTANASGAVLMEELRQDRTSEQLVTSLVDSFSISVTQAESDVESFIRALDASGLLEEPA